MLEHVRAFVELSFVSRQFNFSTFADFCKGVSSIFAPLQEAETMIKVDIWIELLRLWFLTQWSYRKLGEYLGISHQAVGRKINLWTQKGISYHDVKDLPLSDATKILLTGRPPHQSRFKLPNYEDVANLIASTKGRKGKPNIRFNYKAYVKEVGEANAVAESTYYAGVKAALRKPKYALTIIEIPGDRLYVDFAGLRLPIGPKKDKNYAYFIVGVLGYSKKTFIRATTHLKQKDWLDFMQWVFIQIGGVVKFIITDNASPLVTTPKPNLKLTKGYDQFCKHHDVIAYPSPPASPNYNYAAEIAVKIFNNEIYPYLSEMSFNSTEELNDCLDWLVSAINERPISGKIESRDELFYEEKSSLRERSPIDFIVPTGRRTITVDKHYRVKVDQIYYSIDHTLFGEKVQVYIYPEKVDIKHNGELSFSHARRTSGDAHAMLLEHMPPEHRVLRSENKAYFIAWAKSQDLSLIPFIESFYSHVSEGDFWAREQCNKFKILLENSVDEGFAGEFVEGCLMCQASNRLSISSLQSMIEVAKLDDDDIEASFACYQQTLPSIQGEQHEH